MRTLYLIFIWGWLCVCSPHFGTPLLIGPQDFGEHTADHLAIKAIQPPRARPVVRHPLGRLITLPVAVNYPNRFELLKSASRNPTIQLSCLDAEVGPVQWVRQRVGLVLIHRGLLRVIALRSALRAWC